MINRLYFWEITFAIIMTYFSCGKVYAAEARAYTTSGVGNLEKCKSIGIQICNSENITIPKYITTDVPPWSSAYHRPRKDGTNMCWLKVKEGGFTKETLSFTCTPIN